MPYLLPFPKLHITYLSKRGQRTQLCLRSKAQPLGEQLDARHLQVFRYQMKQEIPCAYG